MPLAVKISDALKESLGRLALSRLEQMYANLPLNLTLTGEDALALEFEDKSLSSLSFDFVQGALAYRLKHRGKESLLQAVAGNYKADAPLIVFDATAGMGRDAMILSSCKGFKVYMFERNLIIHTLLSDALRRAKADESLILPVLMPCGGIEQAKEAGLVPDVIYYDPMFPPRRKSALVKKEMRQFKLLIGEDPDIEEYLSLACSMALKKVVFKRPQDAPQVECGDLKPSYSVNGGSCRFDVYVAPGRP